MVAGYQRRPPCAVGMRSALSPFAIAARLWPAARSRLIRSIAYWDIVGGPAEPDALRALDRERLPRPLRDQPPLELGEGGEQVRQRLPGRRRRLEGAVEGDERPAVLLRGRDQAGEVEQRAREPDPLRGDERLRVSALEYPPRLLDARRAQREPVDVGPGGDDALSPPAGREPPRAWRLTIGS